VTLDAGALDLVSAPLTETLQRLSVALAKVVPHRRMAQLSPTCAYAPFQTREDAGVPRLALTPTDVAALGPLAIATGFWQGRAVLAGAEVPVVVLSSEVTEPRSILVLELEDGAQPTSTELQSALTLWSLTTAHRVGLQVDVVPGALSVSRAAAAARAVTIAELGDEYVTRLRAILRVLRDDHMDPSRVRVLAAELASEALRNAQDRAALDQTLAEERSIETFDRLIVSLRRSLRGHGVRLDVRRPGTADGAERMLPSDVARVVSAALRAVVHTIVENRDEASDSSVTRIHLGWESSDEYVRSTIRDNGSGVWPKKSFEARRVVERLAPLGGRVRVEAIPDWGTTVVVEVPLNPDREHLNLLTQLTEREQEVLAEIARGKRNRDIAELLNVGESTVKFHLAKIFEKLGVSTRGEAAALALRASPSVRAVHSA
jgi:DNA-binding NarL/FixJ family response regulator